MTTKRETKMRNKVKTVGYLRNIKDILQENKMKSKVWVSSAR